MPAESVVKSVNVTQEATRKHTVDNTIKPGIHFIIVPNIKFSKEFEVIKILILKMYYGHICCSIVLTFNYQHLCSSAYWIICKNYLIGFKW